MLIIHFLILIFGANGHLMCLKMRHFNLWLLFSGTKGIIYVIFMHLWPLIDNWPKQSQVGEGSYNDIATQ
jgi:hypothetical protein